MCQNRVAEPHGLERELKTNKLIMLKKYAVGAILASALIASTAFAAANLTFLTVDGGTDATVTEGDSVSAEVTFDVTASTDVESLSWELVGSSLPKTCVNVSNSITDGTFTRSFEVDTTGASEGSWDVRIGLYGDDGANASNLCEVTDQIGGLTTFGDRITVTDNNNDNQDEIGGSGSSSKLSQLEKAIEALTALVAKIMAGGTTVPPTQNAACAALATKMVGTQQFVYNDSNVRLQGFLLSEGASIPALSAGASFGYYGTQTSAAVSWYKTVKGCQ